MRLARHLADSQFARGALVYFVLPNLGFILLSREFLIGRPLINSDYLFLWVGSCYLSRRATIGAYAVLAGLDLILSTESIYHFSTVDLILMMRDLVGFERVVSWMLAGALLVGLTVLAAGLRRPVIRAHLSTRSQFLIGASALAVTGASVAHSVEQFDVRPEMFGDNVIADSGVAETVLAAIEFETASSGSQKVFPVRDAATSRVARDFSAEAGSAGPYNIALILVESQGLLKSTKDMGRVLAPLLDAAIQERYLVTAGAVRFRGVTTSGELRALCRIYVPYAIPSNLKGLQRCLPNTLLRRGFETVSYHAFSRWFYERWNWYPAIGFQRSYFADELQALSPPRLRDRLPGRLRPMGRRSGRAGIAEAGRKAKIRLLADAEFAPSGRFPARRRIEPRLRGQRIFARGRRAL